MMIFTASPELENNERGYCISINKEKHRPDRRTKRIPARFYLEGFTVWVVKPARNVLEPDISNGVRAKGFFGNPKKYHTVSTAGTTQMSSQIFRES